MPLDPNNLQGEKLSAFPEAIDLSDIWLAAFKRDTANYYIKAGTFALKANTYTKNEVTALLQTLANTLTVQIKAINQTYIKVFDINSETSIVTDTELKGATLLLSIFNNMDVDGIILDNSTGTVDLSAIGGAYPGDKLKIVYNKNQS